MMKFSLSCLKLFQKDVHACRLIKTWICLLSVLFERRNTMQYYACLFISISHYEIIISQMHCIPLGNCENSHKTWHTYIQSQEGNGAITSTIYK